MHRAVFTASALLQGGGVFVAALHFDAWSPWLYVGMTAFLGGMVSLNAGLLMCRTRTLEEEFNAGYRIGLRAGRRTVGKTVVSIEGRMRHSGRLPKAPIGSVSGHRSAAGREQAHAD